MDPIEIFVLSGYVVDASASSPELAVFSTEIRPYVVQRARAVNAIFTSEMRAYVIYGKTNARPAISRIYVYAVTANSAGGPSVPATQGFRSRLSGANVRKSAMYSIEPDNSGSSLGTWNTLYPQDGAALHKSTLYTIEIP